MDRTTQRRIVRLLDHLAEYPRPEGVVKMQGEENLWRLRIGDYQLIYEVYDDRLVVVVLRVGHRREVYRKGKCRAKARRAATVQIETPRSTAGSCRSDPLGQQMFERVFASRRLAMITETVDDCLRMPKRRATSLNSMPPPSLLMRPSSNRAVTCRRPTR
ncbi:type II toxin-antitoxin system RelE/ParE family toxin [Phycisphaerales bacterium AB-hyl4]|uniref:Type II toxin-antitoxin system RelE/ParE family toxin n=1 Tax=Natronomicrosphaera hydrolytica TaxID=3242702 RepID=A0ABV4UAH2_9BACT